VPAINRRNFLKHASAMLAASRCAFAADGEAVVGNGRVRPGEPEEGEDCLVLDVFTPTQRHLCARDGQTPGRPFRRAGLCLSQRF